MTGEDLGIAPKDAPRRRGDRKTHRNLHRCHRTCGLGDRRAVGVRRRLDRGSRACDHRDGDAKALNARPSLRERTVVAFLSFSPEYMSRIASGHIASIEIEDRRSRSRPLSNQGDVALPSWF
jgi:hypothetical protein